MAASDITASPPREPSITGYFWLWHKRVPARGPRRATQRARRPNRPHGKGNGQSRLCRQPGAAAETPCEVCHRGGEEPRGPGRRPPCPQHRQAKHRGWMAAVQTGKGGWWQRGRRRRDAEPRTVCKEQTLHRMPPLLQGGPPHGTHKPRSCPPWHHPDDGSRTSPSLLIAGALEHSHPVSGDGVSPPLPSRPRCTHLGGWEPPSLPTAPPSADRGQRLSRAAQEHPRTHASPATSPERVGPWHLAAFKRTVLLSSGGRGWRRQCPQPLPEPPPTAPPAPAHQLLWVPRWDLGFQLLNAKWSLGC